MSRYWFIIVLVTLSTVQLNAVPYYPYDNPCTRVTAGVSLDQVVGKYKVYYSAIPLPKCTGYKIEKHEDHFDSSLIFGKEITGTVPLVESYENPNKPGQTENYPYLTSSAIITALQIKPSGVSSIVAHKEGVGRGLIICPAKNNSDIILAIIFANPGANQIEIDDIKNQVNNITNGLTLFAIDQNDCS
ncbi:hypothetical protein CHUAL_000187 [Chamberlinius hualienensis]